MYTLCIKIALFPDPVVLCAITQTLSHPQWVIQQLPTTRSLPVKPTRASSSPPGASPPALLPKLSFLHLEGVCGWGGVSLAVAAWSLTQAPCPLTDPSVACSPPQPDRHSGVLWGWPQRATCPSPRWLNSACDSVRLSGPPGVSYLGDVSGQVCGRGFSEVTQAPELPSASCRHSGHLSRLGSRLAA